ncbi:MAG: YggS family pyridoxal phosphate-dependent enzyme [Moraxella sp.]|nr:YggS family pyridoxal phosphate-dependent enzyme [Moraxella sp.]
MRQDELYAHYEQVTSQLTLANEQNKRTNPAKLLAVSKTKPASDIRALFGCGQRDFGENYLQEAIKKQSELGDLPITWHYIGSIQRNKTRDIAAHFDWVHTIEREVIATRLNEQRGELPPLNVLIQVNIDDENTKSGIEPDELLTLARQVATLPKLCLRGMMIIPAKDSHDAFVRAKALFDEVADLGEFTHWDTLSMGMSADMADAVANGATMVRVGTALFGARDYSV